MGRLCRVPKMEMLQLQLPQKVASNKRKQGQQHNKTHTRKTKPNHTNTAKLPRNQTDGMSQKHCKRTLHRQHKSNRERKRVINAETMKPDRIEKKGKDGHKRMATQLPMRVKSDTKVMSM